MGMLSTCSISKKIATAVCNLLNAVDVVSGESFIDLCSQFKKVIETFSEPNDSYEIVTLSNSP